MEATMLEVFQRWKSCFKTAKQIGTIQHQDVE